MCGPSEAEATSVGHTHIDVAWLWTLSQTRQKVCRSFATVLKLMDEYPEYVFMSSQPQLYQYLKEDHPDLYEKVKEKILEGRWEAEGAMWVEADCNLSSGESLIRQILHGKRFFMNEFGVDNRVLWLPDVFGYSALMPQIMKKCGIDYFMTTKINWCQFNKFPADTFMWAGIDGSEVLSHLITTKEIGRSPDAYFTTYNGFLSPEAVIGAWRRYQDKRINNDVLVSYGYGDGGGGPTREQLEYGRRMEKGLPGCPKVVQGASLGYFDKLQARVGDHKYLPRWVGELYLEYHRGTYTSMGRNKRYNRKSEFLYQDAEFLRVLSAGAGLDYPAGLLHKGWECILLNQFHDILPGSSIKEVYDESRVQYEQIKATGEELIGQALHGVSAQMDLEKDGIVVFNTLGFERDGTACLCVPDGFAATQLADARTREAIPCQVAAREFGFDEEDFSSAGCKTENILFHAARLPSKGCNAYYLGDAAPDAPITMTVTPERMENQYFIIRLDPDGAIAELYDKRCGRQVLKGGRKGNALQAFEDKPMSNDNWDIDIFYLEKMWEVNDVEKIEVIETGPVRGGLRIFRRFSDSRIVQDVYIYNDIPRIDFDTHVDWKENQVLLKVQFPIDVNAAKVTCDLSYGNVERNAHWNTSWDVGKFEVCAHKWVDVSEGGYGVSLLNDCKYGHDIREGDMRLTLVKSGNEPNPEADRERHRFTYSLFPHEGGWKEAETVKMAYDLNVPLYCVPAQGHAEPVGGSRGGKFPASFSFMGADSANVMIEVVKKAEDGDDIIVRLYEFHNARARTTVTLFEKFGRVAECDLLENEIGPCDLENGRFSFDMKPYEIKTFKLCK
jgi:alpha-mannosidase